jgi:hypothetical protein
MIPPLWLIQAGGALALVAAIFVGGCRHGAGTEQAKTAVLIKAAEASARAVENRRVMRLQEAQDAAELSRQAAQRDAVASRAAVVSLRQQADQFARSVPGDPASAACCSAADDRARVLADLLGRASERADELAGAADSARIAGQLCTAAYDALTVR